MKAIVKRSSENSLPIFAIEVILELGDLMSFVKNYKKEPQHKKAKDEEVINAILERVVEPKISKVIEDVTRSLEMNTNMEFYYPEIEMLSLPESLDDFVKTVIHMKLTIPFELIALPLMDKIEKTIESTKY